MEQNYSFFMKENMDNYIGEWIAVCDKKIVSHGRNPQEVYREAKAKYPNKKILLTKIPDKETMIF